MNVPMQNEESASPKRKSSSVHHRSLHLLRNEQARALLAIAKGHRHEALLSLALVLGLRAGELLALQWQAIDWETGSLLVRLTHPTQRCKAAHPLFLPTKYPRTILLPQRVRDCLRERVLCQQRECMRAGLQWQQQGLVLYAKPEHPLSSGDLTSIVQGFQRQAHVPVLRFHELRHTTASLLLLSGIAPEMIGEILGIGVQGIARPHQRRPFSPEGYEKVRQTMEHLFF